MTNKRSTTSIHARDLSFQYHGASDFAVKDVNLTVEKGEIAALVGPSGCGKSTLLRLVSGLLNPTKGVMYFGDQDASQIPPEDRGVGWVPQSYGLFEHLSVWENIAFGLKARKRPASEITPAVEEALTLTHISDLADRRPSALSGGQRQRVAIARALATQPSVLLLDEPLAALDPQLRASLRVTLSEILRRSGVTTIMVTHDQTEALAMADRVAVMRDGQLQQYATPETLWNDPSNAFVAEFVGAATVLTASRNGDQYTVVNGLDFSLPSEDSANVSVALRAADLQPNRKGNGARFHVLSREYTGTSWVLTGELLDSGDTVKALSSEAYEVGEICHITLTDSTMIAKIQK